MVQSEALRARGAGRSSRPGAGDRVVRQTPPVTLATVCGLGCWLGIAALAVSGAASGGGALAPGYLLLCVLLVIAPACLALPAGQALRAPWWAVETVLAWAALGYLLLFVNPQLLGRGPALIIVLLALGGALASPALLWAAHRPAHARRLRWQGYLGAAVLCALLGLRALGALGPINLGLVVLIALITQWLLLTVDRGQGRSTRMER
ncbi:MAG: hypothetical protein ACTHMU_18835 [Thermomicrobiales bacterium]|nr:hypothetical protein [Thermomicrobiales bacterium]